MTSAKTLLISILCLVLAACATAPVTEDAEQVADREAEFESQRLVEEAVLQEEREREAGNPGIAEQPVVRQLNNTAEVEARANAEAEARARAEAEAQREAQLREYRARNTEPAPDVRNETEENEQEIARVRTKVAELREQIAANRTETEKLESSNAALREAITTAENLSQTLSEEQQKYSAVDPATGQTVDALARARIEELKAQVERLKAQAAALSQPPP